jgi:membrane-associated phospholipid phosphatase
MDPAVLVTDGRGGGDVESGRRESSSGAEEVEETFPTPVARAAPLPWWSYALDALLFLVVGALALVAEVAEPVDLGFFASDETIAYSLRSDTVPSWVVPVLGLLVPLAFLGACVPLVRFQVFWSGARSIVLGFCGTVLFTDVIKVIVGWPRPNFLAVCDPDLSGAAAAANATTLIPTQLSSEICRGEPAAVHEALKSFPSGHASVSAFGLMSVVFLLERFASRVRDQSFSLFAFLPREAALLRPSLQILLASIPIYVAATRVSDHKHRILDILVGLVIGTAVAFIAIYRTIPLRVGLLMAFAAKWRAPSD